MYPAKYNNNLVSVQYRSGTAGQFNDEIEWVELKQVWVSIIPNRSREKYSSDELETLVSHTIRGDYLELQGITSQMRIIYHDTHVYDPIPDSAIVFDILGVMPDYDNKADVMMQAAVKSQPYGDLPADIPE